MMYGFEFLSYSISRTCIHNSMYELYIYQMSQEPLYKRKPTTTSSTIVSHVTIHKAMNILFRLYEVQSLEQYLEI